MANLFASFTGDNSWAYVYSGTLQGQTCVIPSDYAPTVSSIKVKLVRIGTVSGNVTISLYAATSDLPTGSALSSASITASSVTTNTAGAWYVFDISDYTMSPGYIPFKVAIVLSHNGTSSSNTIAWRVKNENAYSDGRGCYKYSGGAWTAYSSPYVRDLAFEIYGYGVPQTMGATTTSNVATTSMNVASSAGDDNGDAITSRGFYYSSTDTTPDSGDSIATSGSGEGSFSATLSSLSPGTTYYIRSFATNTAGTSVGAVKTQATTVAVPTVTTQAASVVTSSGFTGNGTVTATGGASISRRGFCYLQGSSGDPTTANSTAYDDGTFGTGAFSKEIGSLSGGTAYRVRAYAVNSAGTAYGSTFNVVTQSATAPTVSTSTTLRLTHSLAKVGGNVSDGGDSAVTERGVYWGTTGDSGY
jgi:hypothetical protein